MKINLELELNFFYHKTFYISPQKIEEILIICIFQYFFNNGLN